MGRGKRQDLTKVSASKPNKKLLAGEKVKYPRTPHLPFSPKRGADDLILADTLQFIGKHVIVTEKVDGESTSIYSDTLHARSPDARDRSQTMRKSREWVRRLHGQMSYEIPVIDGVSWRICGENMAARHTVAYETLPSFFLVYNIWDENNHALSWKQTEEWCQLLGLSHVPVLYDGLYDEEKIKGLGNKPSYGDKSEGFVIRIAEGFDYNDFANSVAKYVNADFEIPSDHWTQEEFQANGLSEDEEKQALRSLLTS
jgi:hypothetical protein